MPLTRGPLPGSIYWRRRLVVVTVVAVLVVALITLISHLGGGHSSSDGTLPGASVSSPGISTAPSVAPSGGSSSLGPSSSSSPVASVSPSGPCQASDVTITPSVAAGAVPGKPVAIHLALVTGTEPACTWAFSSHTVQVAVSQRGSDVWSTIDCPSALSSQALVLRQDVPVGVDVVWNAHVMSTGCSVHTPWAGLGTYRVNASALGGEPATAVFQLSVPTVTAPPSPTSTPTATARPTAHPGSAAPSASAKPSVTPGAKPSSAGRGD